MDPDPRIEAVEHSIRTRAHLQADGWQSRDMASLMEKEHIPGASVAVIDNWQVAWSKSYGVKRAGEPDPVTTETLFQAASISKPVAALAALSLLQEGRLSLDEDINACLTGWRIPANHGWHPRVTLRQLLSHSAGMTVHGFPGYAAGAPVPSLVQVLDGENPANTPPVQVDTLPGLHFRYSGGGFTVLQQLLEDVTGMPFWRAVEERVLLPLGMDHTTYRCPLPATWQVNAARGHRADGQPLAGGWHTYPESAAAGMWTTPLDIARMLLEIETVLRGEPGKVLSRAMAEEMVKPQVRVSGLSLVGWEGLSLFLTEEDGWYAGHGGSNEGYRAQFIIRKGKGQAAVIMTNSDSGEELTDAWMGTLALEYGWTGFAWQPPAALELEGGDLTSLTGKYRSGEGLEFEVLCTPAGLQLVHAGQPPLALRARTASRFFTVQINAEVTFSIKDGACNALTFRQNGTDLTTEKLLD